GVIGVTALRNVGTKVGFSSLGTASAQPTIGAPGGNCVNLSGACLFPILSATNTGSTVPVASGYSDSFDYTLGTSFSSPLVAGVAALIVSVNPSATPAQVKNFITSTARSFPTTGGGTSGMGACRAAVANVVQDECYCNSFCGAGMLDAGAAVAAAAGSTVTPPSAAITVSPASPLVGQTVTLSSSSTAGSFTITGYLWRLVSGGGAVPALANGSTLGSGSSVTLTPTAAGTVQVSLQVTDAGGNTNQTTRTFTVAAATGPTASFTVSPAAPTAGSAFTLTSTATAGSFAISSQQWTLVDGGGVVSGLANGGSLGTGSTASVTANAAGTVVVSLRVTDTAGNTGTVQQSLSVAAAPTGGGGGGGGGGGATSPYWLAGLSLAVLALFRTRPSRA
ncbi:MAG: S8 family serine peptidase, partial [Rubrivivax sp.]|nr:S8 family serine peptidase [Rubrivivax sp.]